MTGYVINFFRDIFLKVIEWGAAIYESIGATGYIVAAFIICLVVGLLLMPIRGGGLSVGGSAIADFAVSKTNSKGKYWNGKTARSKPGYHGKYEKGHAGKK